VTAPVNRLDDESLQRGARNFVNYCLNCHSAQYMRYNRLTDLGIDRVDDPGQPDVRHRQGRQAMTVAMTARTERRGSARRRRI
jgi:cytochrome c1